MLLVCDCYLGLDQQYHIPLGSGTSGGTGGGAAGEPLPLVGQAARRQRRVAQQEARRQHAAEEAQQAEQQAGAGGAPMDVDAHQQQQAPDALPQRAPRRPRGSTAQQLAAEAAPTLDCRLGDAGDYEDEPH